MSIAYCEKHSIKWDSDKLEECPLCENEHEPRDTHTGPKSNGFHIENGELIFYD